MFIPDNDYLTHLYENHLAELRATSHADQWLEAHDYHLPPSTPSSPPPLPPMTPFGEALFAAVCAQIARAYGDEK